MVFLFLFLFHGPVSLYFSILLYPSISLVFLSGKIFRLAVWGEGAGQRTRERGERGRGREPCLRQIKGRGDGDHSS